MSEKIVKLPNDDRHYWRIPHGVPVTEENVRRHGVAIEIPVFLDPVQSDYRAAAAEVRLRSLQGQVAAIDAERSPAPRKVTEDPIQLAVARTLRMVAEWGNAVSPEILTDIADQVDALYADEACCPVCEEVDCDNHCPLAPVRAKLRKE